MAEADKGLWPELSRAGLMDRVAAEAAPVPARADTVSRLAAVHAVLSPDRQATVFDILVTTFLELLRAGPKSEAELLVEAERVWPGTGTSAQRLLSALSVAERIGYISRTKVASLDGWTLTRLGNAEVDNSRAWADDVLHRFAAELQSRVAASGRQISPEDGELWAAVLIRALHAAIRASFAAHRGDVSDAGRALLPRAFDHQVLHYSISVEVQDQVRVDILEALALEALDPLSSFGNEVVTHITVGYMLHAYVGRRDRVGARAAVGSLRGDRAILDTPVLLNLLRPRPASDPTEHAIKAAIDAGMEVVVPGHYVEELVDLLLRIEREDLPRVSLAIEDGTSPEAIAQLIDEPVIDIWLRGHEKGMYLTWEDYVTAARDLPTRLGLMGVIVRDHRNAEADRVIDFRDALSRELEATGAGRGRSAVQRDADTMAMARRRRHRTDYLHLFWPGAWVITTDRHMAPAYKAVETQDRFPLTLTPAQWMSLLASTVPPAELDQLASAAAALLSEETFMKVACHYPVGTALDIARALAPDTGASAVDLRISQLNLDDLIERAPDFSRPNDPVGAEIAAAVVAKRGIRMNEVARNRIEDAESRAKTAAEREVAERRRAAEEETAKIALLEQIKQAQAEIDAVKADAKRSKRTIIGRVLLLPMIVGTAAAFIFTMIVPGLIALAATIVFWLLAEDWRLNPDKTWTQLLPAALLALISVLASLWPYAFPLGNPK